MKQETDFKSIVLIGKIASGKGTQATMVAEHFDGVLYSNGNKVRAAAKELTPFGVKMKETYEAGYLMPEWVASYWMTEAIVREHQNDRIIFEGVAKKPNEAELFHEIHHWIDRPYVVFNLDVTDEEVRRRSAERARDAVDLHSIDKRLEEYHTYTARSIEFFRTKGTLIDIDGSQSPEAVLSHIITYLHK